MDSPLQNCDELDSATKLFLGEGSEICTLLQSFGTFCGCPPIIEGGGCTMCRNGSPALTQSKPIPFWRMRLALRRLADLWLIGGLFLVDITGGHRYLLRRSDIWRFLREPASRKSLQLLWGRGCHDNPRQEDPSDPALRSIRTNLRAPPDLSESDSKRIRDLQCRHGSTVEMRLRWWTLFIFQR